MKRTKDIGDLGETVATKYLRKNKFKIIERNLHKGRYEIDIVAKDKEHLIFVEVKTRCVDSEKEIAFETSAALAVDAGKRTRTVAAAKIYLSEHPTDKQPRFDVIEVYLSKGYPHKVVDINHIKNAF